MLTISQPDWLAMCRCNVNLFTEHVLGVKQAALHQSIQALLTRADSAMVMLPRGHGKTTQSACRVAHVIGNDPDYRWKYIQQNDDEAKKTVRLIKLIIESDHFRQVFPEIQPDPELWGSSAISVKRRHYTRDATVEAVGIFGRAGGRADGLVADDVCDLRNAIQQPALRPQVKEAWNNTWEPMLDAASDRRKVIWKFGTPYHVGDINADWRKMHGDDNTLLEAPVVGFRSPWPEVYTAEVLKKRRARMGPVAFARAYELRPISGAELLFKPEWLDNALFETMPRWSLLNSQVRAAIDWAFTTPNAQAEDPDWSVMITGRHDDNGHVFVLDMLRERCEFVEFKRRAIEFGETHEVEYCTAEANGPQKALVQQINSESSFPIVAAPRGKGKIDKISRATAKQAFVESGRLHIRAERDGNGLLRPIPELQALYDELTTFPASEHDDTVDAVVDLIGTIDRAPKLEMPQRIIPKPRRPFGRFARI